MLRLVPLCGAILFAPAAQPTASSAAFAQGYPARKLCIGGQTYTLRDHDEFDRDSTLSVSDIWPPSGGKVWSNRFQWGRTNNPGTDDAYYPDRATVAAWGVPPVAAIVPGAGVSLSAYPVPRAFASDSSTVCSARPCRGHLAGLLTSNASHASGYWVFSAKLPSGDGWWPAVWLQNETGSGGYDELDNEEEWGPSQFGPNVVQQTQQCVSPACSGPSLYERTTVTTSATAQHTYGALATSNYVGFYIDNVPTTSRYPRFTQSGLDPIMNLQVCTKDSYCAPAPATDARAAMIVKYYRYYAPPDKPAPCPEPYDLPPLPP